MTRIGNKEKQDVRGKKAKPSVEAEQNGLSHLQRGIVQVSKDGEIINSLDGSMLWLPPNPAPPAWLEYAEPCVAYRNKFGVPVSLPFWFINSMSHAQRLIEEAVAKGRRRWVVECGPWVCNPPITTFREVVEAAGKSLDRLTFRETANIWLDPPEWIEPISKQDEKCQTPDK